MSRAETGAYQVDRILLPRDEQCGQLVGGREANAFLSTLATKQHGVAARRQLIARGIGPGLIESYLRRGWLHRRYPGVYAVGHSSLTRYGRWLAAVLACGQNAVLSHASAAALWGLRGDRSPIEILRRSSSRQEHEGLRVHRDRSLGSDDVTTEYGIPVVRPERAILQIASRLDPTQIVRCLAAADRSRILRWDQLEQVVSKTTVRGSRRLRQAMAVFDPSFADAASPGELDFLLLAGRYGLPSPAVGVHLYGLIVDFYWPDCGVVVEYDGFGFHGDRVSFEEDRRRDALLKSHGIEVIRVTHRMLRDDSRAFFEMLHAVLRRRQAAGTGNG